MNIKDLRTASGMTQQQFSDYFNIPKRTIENWEGGQRKCPEYLLELMEYKLEAEGLLTGKPIEYLKMRIETLERIIKEEGIDAEKYFFK